ncbi:MAG: pyridoxal-phosphate dependent enzyme [Chloroherpetonaceae bacterium]|nr:pyridoxal-phosphate dependent enzyme [Chloroherpetonaceae bacterium]MCS7211457.1 pyridoxal-phosphate dependent enzyme [Chloroherpetonaceae bacterium]MDW8020032.1 pyridoxal-phosphate dependent enzyme [Chloroherpetonaceae bacterium]
MWYESILDTIGKTPMVRLHRIAKSLKPVMLAKLEFMNPGGSIKDRIALSMIEHAEKNGLIKPGGTIIEWTAGNTGIGLALVAAVKGYKCIMVMPDKVSQEKIDLLRALGSEVVITPTAVKPEDPRSCYSVAEHLAKTIPNSYYPNQFVNEANPDVHYRTTAEEIWEQTDGKVTHVFAPMGTGGTVSGIARRLKEYNPKVKVIGIDSVGSAYTHYFKTREMPPEIGLWKLEGMGGSRIPKTADFDILDDVIPVSDGDAFTAGRMLSKLEGIFAGGSSGAALFAAMNAAKQLQETDVVVVMITDTGARYISKMYNDLWMKENNFSQSFSGDKSKLTAADVLATKKHRKLIFVMPETPLYEAFELMKQYEISQVPVISDGAEIGSISDNKILHTLLSEADAKFNKVVGYMEKPFPILPPDASLAQLSDTLSRDNAVLIGRDGEEFEIITKSDLIAAITA